MRKLAVVLLAAFLCLGVGSQASAAKIPFYVNVAPLGNTPTGGGTYNTDLMDEASLIIASQITQNVTQGNGTLVAGDTFSEDLVGFSDAFIFHVAANDNDQGLEDLPPLTGFELTLVGQDMPGVLTAVVGTTLLYSFDAGSIVNIYLDDKTAGGVGEPHSTIDTTDPQAIGSYTGFNDGTLFAKLQVVTGQGTLDTATGNGSTFLTLRILNDDPSYLGRWFDENGVDLLSYSITLAFVDTTETDAAVIPGYPTVGTTSYDIRVAGNGGVEVAVVPEPAAMLLLGSGLIGLAAVARRRFKR